MNLDRLIKIINSNTHEYLEKNKDIIVNELIQLGLKSKDQQKMLQTINKITRISKNPKTRESLIRSFFRIFREGIDKDGRGSSIIIEITKRCNKNCKHCYSKFSGKNTDMPDDLLERLIRFSKKHYKHIFLTGGEPTLDPRVLTVAKDNPDVVFFIFTNGSTITDSYAKQLSDLGNVIPIIGIDGSTESSHDELRGKGSYKEVMNAIKSLQKHDVSWGCITLVTEDNANDVLNEKFVEDKIKKGAFLLRYLEYTPVGPRPMPELILSGETYYLLEKRKKEIMTSGQIYMQDIGQSKCRGLLFFTVDGLIKNCFSFHYAKYNAAKGDIKKSISNVRKEWITYDWKGECPLYSYPQGFKNHLEKIGWKHTSTVEEPYLTDPKIAEKLMRNYKKFLQLVEQKGL